MNRFARMHSSVSRLMAAGTHSLVLLLMVLAAPAEAQVAFHVPPHCGSQREFFASVQELQQAEAAQVTLTSVVIAESAPGAYELTLTGPDGDRVFSDVDCRTLFRTAVVVAAAAARDRPASTGVTVVPVRESDPQVASPRMPSEPTATTPRREPAAVGREAESSPPSAPDATVAVLPPTAPPAVAAEPSVPPDETTAAAGTPTVFVAAGFGAAVGLSPEPTLMFELEAGLGSHDWGGLVGARYLTPSEATTQGDAGVRVESFGGRVAVFYRVMPRLRATGGLSAYRMEARGVGIRYPSTDTVWLFAPELELALVVPLGVDWAAAFGLVGRVGFSTPSFQIQPETEVFELPRFGALGVFRIEWTRR